MPVIHTLPGKSALENKKEEKMRKKKRNRPTLKSKLPRCQTHSRTSPVGRVLPRGKLEVNNDRRIEAFASVMRKTGGHNRRIDNASLPSERLRGVFKLADRAADGGTVADGGGADVGAETGAGAGATHAQGRSVRGISWTCLFRPSAC